jgi:hypothetical protein
MKYRPKPNPIAYALLVLMLAGCVSTAEPLGLPGSSWSTVAPGDTDPRRQSPVPEATSEQADTCLSSIEHQSDLFIKLTMEMDEQGMLTYCIQLNSVGGDPGIAPDLIIHFPETMQSARTSGTGWVCERTAPVEDDILPGMHVDDHCRNASAHPRYPGLVRVMLPKDQVDLGDRLCVQAVIKDRIEMTCIATDP